MKKLIAMAVLLPLLSLPSLATADSMSEMINMRIYKVTVYEVIWIDESSGSINTSLINAKSIQNAIYTMTSFKGIKEKHILSIKVKQQ